MDLYEFNTCSFVVKIWLEEGPSERGQALWRGHITHIPSGERHYVHGLDDITLFIIPYLEKMGIRIHLLWRMKRWLNMVRKSGHN